MLKKHLILIITLILVSSSIISAQQIVPLPVPKIRGELMKALKNRATFRKFSTCELTQQTLSEVLWAAYGVNNDRTGRRTVATAFNIREMLVYVLTKNGGFRYDANNQALVQVTGEDIREFVATQDYAENVPVHLIYVADYNMSIEQSPKWAHSFVEGYSLMHTGQIAQNVYLYCAANDLGTIVRDVVNKDDIGEKLKLKEKQKIIASQIIGYPMK